MERIRRCPSRAGGERSWRAPRAAGVFVCAADFGTDGRVGCDPKCGGGDAGEEIAALAGASATCPRVASITSRATPVSAHQTGKLAPNPCGLAGMSRSMSSLRMVSLESCWPVVLGKILGGVSLLTISEPQPPYPPDGRSPSPYPRPCLFFGESSSVW